MTPALKQVLNDLNQLSIDEQWTLLGYLMNQLQKKMRLVIEPKTRPVDETVGLSVTEQLNAVYALEDSHLDPAIAYAQSLTLPEETW